MTDKVAEALSDLENRLVSILAAVRRAQHGSIHALRELDRCTVYGGVCDPFLFAPVAHSLADAIREQALGCPSAPGSGH